MGGTGVTAGMPEPNRRMTDDTSQHLELMKRALRLARRGRGQASPNPLVGCVVARAGKVLGEGFHTYTGVQHAEALALGRAGSGARGADLYVTLEPCCHQGRTPPCVERILEAGIHRVWVGVRDPNPLVAGKGILALRQAGVEVAEGLCAPQAEQLNEAFFHFIQTGRPFVLLKLALTLDGKIATSTGDSQWITGPRARRWSHRLRYEYDAILVGIETLLEDDPSLTVRWRRNNRITRVILDSQLRTPPDARLFSSPDPVIIFHQQQAPASARRLLEPKADLQAVQAGPGGLSWRAVLGELGEREILSLVVEGGSRVAASALRARAVQKVCFFYGPKILGGRDSSGIGDLGVQNLDQAVQLSDLKVRRLAPDLMVEGYCAPGRSAVGEDED